MSSSLPVNLLASILEQIFAASPDLVFIQDQAGRFTYVNAASAEAFNVERFQLLGKTWEDLNLSAENKAALTARSQATLSTGQGCYGELQVSTARLPKEYEYTLSLIQQNDMGVNLVLLIARDASARNQAERSLRFSEAKYRYLFESATDFIFIIDASTYQILDANWNAARQLGYTRAELLQLSICDVEAPMSAKQRATILHQLENEGSSVFEHIYLRKNGEKIPVEISAQIIEYDNRLVFQSFVRDITERKRKEAEIQALNADLEQRVLRRTAELSQVCDELAATNAEMKALFAAMDDLIIVYDRHGRHLKTLAANERLLIRPAKEKVNKTLHELFPAELADRLLGYIHTALNTQQPVRAEYPLIINDQECWSDASVSPIDDNLVIWAIRDATDRKQMEKALQESEERFRVVFEQAAVGITVISPAGRFLRANQRFCEIIGYSESELLKQKVSQITHPDDLALDLTYAQQMLAGNISSFSMRKRYIRKDGEACWVNLAGSIVRDAQNAPLYFIGVIVDIA
jgi:PAS domain S-box-containing protein